MARIRYTTSSSACKKGVNYDQSIIKIRPLPSGFQQSQVGSSCLCMVKQGKPQQRGQYQNVKNFIPSPRASQLSFKSLAFSNPSVLKAYLIVQMFNLFLIELKVLT